MNLKKHLKLKEEEVPFSEKDKEFFQSLLAEVEQNAQQRSAVLAKRRKILLAWLIPVVAAFLGGIIAVICIFGFKHNNLPPLYKDENIQRKASSYAEMQQDVKYFNFQQIEQTSNQYRVNYDAITNDNLYYTFEASYELSSFQFTIVTNQNYEFNFDVVEDLKTEQLTNYSVTYSSIEKPFEFIPSINYKGWIKVQTETVYFDYTQVPNLGDEAFFTSIQQIIQVK